VRGGPTTLGIGGLAYRMRWAPNDVQTSVEWVVSMVAQFLLRGRAYAEIVGGPTTGVTEQYLPRHPDRVRPERLPSGRMRYKLTEASGQPRYLTQEEMLVVRDLSFDGGLTSTSRIQYGAQAIAIALAAAPRIAVALAAAPRIALAVALAPRIALAVALAPRIAVALAVYGDRPRSRAAQPVITDWFSGVEDDVVVGGAVRLAPVDTVTVQSSAAQKFIRGRVLGGHDASPSCSGVAAVRSPVTAFTRSLVARSIQ